MSLYIIYIPYRSPCLLYIHYAIYKQQLHAVRTSVLLYRAVVAISVSIAIAIAKFRILRTWPWTRCWNNHYRYKHKIWYVHRGWGGTHRDVAEISNFKFSNGFFVSQRKKSPKTLNKICQRYGKIRSFKCGENLSSDHTMTTPKSAWGLILPLVRSNDR